MCENIKYTMIEDKYTINEFMEIYEERSDKLTNHFPNWHIVGNNGTRHIFKIPVDEIPEN